jgi:hypothetical protein
MPNGRTQRRRGWLAAGLLAALLAAPPIASAQQRPLVTEDPETVGAGLVLLEVGMDYGHDYVFPASGLRGDLLRLPLVGLSVGISSIAELQLDVGLRNRLSITEREEAPLSGVLDFEGDSTTDVDDLVVATKIRVLSESTGRPAIGVRFATKLPNASNESGLGLDVTDFFASLLVGKTVESIRIVGNAGLGILGDATRPNKQRDVLVYGISFARAVAQGFDVVGEINGFTGPDTPPPGRENRALMRLGSRYTRGPGRLDGALLIGMTSRDPGFGFTVGYTHVFSAFRVP